MKSRPRQILALGGGGFSMEPDNPLLDLHLLSLTAAPMPRVCFLPTASGDSDNYIARFFSAFSRYECRAYVMSLFKLPTRDVRGHLLGMDAIFVGGGNTKTMLAIWREWGMDAILRDAWDAGVVLSGVSAGAMCWFEQGLTDSIIGELNPLACLGLLRGSFCPHYDGEAERRPQYRRAIASGALPAGVAADDGAALHYVDTELAGVVKSRPGARAFRVFVREGEVVEDEMPATALSPGT